MLFDKIANRLRSSSLHWCVWDTLLYPKCISIVFWIVGRYSNVQMKDHQNVQQLLSTDTLCAYRKQQLMVHSQWLTAVCRTYKLVSHVEVRNSLMSREKGNCICAVFFVNEPSGSHVLRMMLRQRTSGGRPIRTCLTKLFLHFVSAFLEHEGHSTSCTSSELM